MSTETTAPATEQAAPAQLETTPAPGKYSGPWWADTADRVISTAAQAAIATLGVGVTGILDVDFIGLASIVGLAGALAFLKSLAVANHAG